MASKNLGLGENTMSYEELFNAYGTHDADNIPKLTQTSEREEEKTLDSFSFFERNNTRRIYE